MRQRRPHCHCLSYCNKPNMPPRRGNDYSLHLGVPWMDRSVSDDLSASLSLVLLSGCCCCRLRFASCSCWRLFICLSSISVLGCWCRQLMWLSLSWRRLVSWSWSLFVVSVCLCVVCSCVVSCLVVCVLLCCWSSCLVPFSNLSFACSFVGVLIAMIEARGGY